MMQFKSVYTQGWQIYGRNQDVVDYSWKFRKGTGKDYSAYAHCMNAYIHSYLTYWTFTCDNTQIELRKIIFIYTWPAFHYAILSNP